MAMLSVNPVDLAHLIRELRECGGDRYDEVWDGVYVMSPLADNEHQQLGFALAWAIKMRSGPVLTNPHFPRLQREQPIAALEA